MSSIALKYGVQTSAIMAANPSIDPNSMSIGTKLVIPLPSSAGFSVNSGTPIPINTGPLACYLSQDGGTWCFLLVQNNQSLPIENIQAKIAIGDMQSGKVFEQLTTAPLNILYPRKAMALSVYFPNEILGSYQTQFELISAMAVEDGNSRYLDTKLENLQVTKGAKNLSAKVYGEVELTSTGLKAASVWAAGIAYDKDGNVVGVRRWVSNSPLFSGQKIAFLFTVYSAGAAIERVDVMLEAYK